MTKYDVRYSQEFKKSLKKVTKQGKNIEKSFKEATITMLENYSKKYFDGNNDISCEE